ncbi:MAG TPA: ABC transporter substrate-binding protein [Humisphaera sp.]
MLSPKAANLGNLHGLVLIVLTSLAAVVGGCKTEESKPAVNPTTAPTAAATPAATSSAQPALATPALAAPAPAARPASPAPDKLRLGYFANFTHAQAVLGVANGDFATAVAPAKVETKVFNAGPSLIEALFAGEIDIGYIGPGPALNGFAKSKGAGVRVIAGAAANGVLVVARKDSGITRLDDIKGKRIATPQLGNTQDIAAKAYVRSLGQTDVGNVKAVPNAEQVGQIGRGEFDVAWAPEPWGSLLVKEAGATVLAKEESLWPEGAFAITVVITTPEFLAKHPDTVERFLKVHVALTDRLAKDPTKELPALKAALLALTNKGLPAGVLESSVANTRFTTDPLRHTFTKFAGWAYDLGIAKDRTDPAALFDTATLDRLKAQGGAGTPKKGLDD